MVRGLAIVGPDRREIELAVEGVIIEIGLAANAGMVGEEVARNRQGEIIVDCSCRTNIPGLFAAGDVTTACGEQIIIAAGEGAKAALGAADFLAFGRAGP